MAKTDITFNDFWEAYNLKRDRQRAERAWNRLPLRDRRAAYQGIEAYQSRCRIEGISIMYAQGYLNNRRWEDEPEPAPLVQSSKYKVQSATTTEGAAKNLEPGTLNAEGVASDKRERSGNLEPCDGHAAAAEPEMLIW